jgi:TPR repeat protein
VAQDLTEAARYYRLAAEQGFAFAQSNLGHLYSDGEGVAQDFVEAAQLYGLAAAQGQVEAVDGLKALAGERTYVSVCCAGCGATRTLKTCAKCKVARFILRRRVRAARVGRARAALHALGGGGGGRAVKAFGRSRRARPTRSRREHLAGRARRTDAVMTCDCEM